MRIGPGGSQAGQPLVHLRIGATWHVRDHRDYTRCSITANELLPEPRVPELLGMAAKGVDDHDGVPAGGPGLLGRGWPHTHMCHDIAIFNISVGDQ